MKGQTLIKAWLHNNSITPNEAQNLDVVSEGRGKKTPKTFSVVLFLICMNKFRFGRRIVTASRKYFTMNKTCISILTSQKIKVVEIKIDLNNRTKSTRCAGNVSPLCFFFVLFILQLIIVYVTPQCRRVACFHAN